MKFLKDYDFQLVYHLEKFYMVTNDLSGKTIQIYLNMSK